MHMCCGSLSDSTGLLLLLCCRMYTACTSIMCAVCAPAALMEGCLFLQEAEKRLRDIVTGKKAGSALAVNGSAARKLGSKQRQQLFVFTVRHPLASGATHHWSAACTQSSFTPDCTSVSLLRHSSCVCKRLGDALQSGAWLPRAMMGGLLLAGEDISWR